MSRAMKYIRFRQADTRCDPFYRQCTLSDQCARHLAAGHPRGDFSNQFGLYAGLAPFCPQYMSVGQAAKIADTKPVKPWPVVR